MSKIDHEKLNKQENTAVEKRPRILVYQTPDGDPKLCARGIITVEDFIAGISDVFLRNKITHLYSPNLYFKK
jgi:hypothetical protein